ncbi:MAG: hypothetical protein QE279_00880 [Rhodoferax sp.]|nr:hypothetical protein [Rhodoferax sp.]
MSIQKFYSLACLTASLLLVACGGGSTETTVKTVNPDKSTRIYMAGAYVEGLSYSAANLSGTTAANGAFKYRVGETVTFKVGTKTIGTYTPLAYTPTTITHFSILGNTDPYSTETVNLSVLLHFLDNDAALSNGDAVLGNGLKVNAERLALADQVGVKLNDVTYLEKLREKASAATPRKTVPEADTVIPRSKAQTNIDKIQVAPHAAGVFTFNEFKSTLTFSAANSTDANGDKLSYQWFIDSKPKASQALIASPTLDTITFSVDADDEPYILRAVVSDAVSAVPLSLEAEVKKTNIAGVYSTGSLQSPERGVVAISDTAELWGYIANTVNNVTTTRAFAGLVSRSDAAADYTVNSLLSCTFLTVPYATCTAENLPGYSFKLDNPAVSRQLTGSVGSSNTPMRATPLPDAPTLNTSLAGTYRELNTIKANWVIARTTFSFSEPSTDGKTVTLCATGDIKIDANSQVVDANGAITKFVVPIKIDFRAACPPTGKTGFDTGSSSTGVLIPDPSLGPGGYTFIGKNPNQTALFVRHLIRQ